MDFILPLISTGICTLSLVLGLFVISLETKKRIHRLFFLSVVAVAFLHFTAIPAFTSNDKNIFIIFYRLGSSAMILSFPLIFYLILTLTNIKSRMMSAALTLFCIAAVILLYYNINLKLVYRDFFKFNGLWHFVKTDTPLLYVAYTYILLNYFLSFYLLVRQRGKLVLKREKKQTSVLLIFLSFQVLFLVTEHAMMQFFGVTDLGLSVYYIFIWPFGIGLAIVKYRFLPITPQQISRDIIENIDESVIILDRNLNVILTNPVTNDLVSGRQNIKIDKIISNCGSVSNDLQKILDGSMPDFKAELEYVSNDNTTFTMSVNISAIRDKYNDITGILFMGQEAKGKKEFIAEYGLTARELDVLELLVTGIPNKDIPEKLSIRKSTAKTHIDHIYKKTNVRNKMELMNLIKEYIINSQ